MMEVEYKREMNRNYMILTPQNREHATYTIRMLNGNTIPGLLVFQDKSVDGEVKYYYDITSRQPLDRMLEHRHMSGMQVRTLITELLYTLKQLERFFLDEGQLCFQPEMIYVDLESFKPGFCLIPGRKADISAELCELSQYLLDHVNHSDGEAVVLAFSVFKECRKLNVGIEDLERCMRQQGVTSAAVTEKTEMFSELPRKPHAEWGVESERRPSENSGSRERRNEYRRFDESARKEIDREEITIDEITRNALDRNEFVPKDGTGNKLQKQDNRYKKQNSVLFRILLVLLVSVMVLIPIILFLWMGIRVLSRWKWYLLAGEGVLLAGILVSYWLLGDDTEAKSRSGSSPRTGTRSNFDSGLPPETWKKYDNERRPKEEDYSDGEPWEVYFREENQESKPQEPEDAFQTILLSAKPVYKECRRLIPIQGGEEIQIGYFPFLIGKNKDLTDYCLNKPGVSRMHVKIEESPEGYLVTDLNSTNGTMINGERLFTNDSAVLRPGDELTIASERYSFR